jgi:hypothetical protein
VQKLVRATSDLTGGDGAMRHWLWLLLLFSVNPIKAVPLPPDPSLDIEVKVQGRFVNWVTGKEQTASVKPQVIWAMPNELPTRTDLLRRAIRNEWRGAQLFFPDFWRRWAHRTVQTLNPPQDWLIWDVSQQPLQLQVSVRDKEKRLTQLRLVTVHEEVTAKVVNGAAKVTWTIKPTDAAVLVLRDKLGVLAFLLMRWTPIVHAERVGIVAEVGPIPVTIGDCEECRQGEAIANQIYEKLRPPKEGFVWVFQRLKDGGEFPDLRKGVPHFRIKPDIILGSRDVPVEFFRSIPDLDLEEAVKIARYETREAIPYLPPSQGHVSGDWWRVYEVQKSRFVVAVWEVRARCDMPIGFSPNVAFSNVVFHRTRDIAEEIVKTLPLEPPNHVAALLVERLRPKVASWRIGLMPRATLWFDGVVIANWFSFEEPPPPESREGRMEQAKRELKRLLREGKVKLGFGWKQPDESFGPPPAYVLAGKKEQGSVRIRWLRWLTTDKKASPQIFEWRLQLPDIVTVFTDAEYEVIPEAPEGFQTIPPFRLTVKTQTQPSEISAFPSVSLTLSSSEQKVTIWKTEPPLDLRAHAWIGIPQWLATLLELRVAFNRTPIKGEVTVVLEGNGRRWERKGFARLEGSWDIPVHPRWYFPHPDCPNQYTAEAIFRYIPPGRYRLKVEGTIGGEANVDVSPFPDKQKIVTQSEPVRQVRWQKTIIVNVGHLDTIVVPLPPP